ncbi:MAG: ABC transporter permease [Terriglobales bacterium]
MTALQCARNAVGDLRRAPGFSTFVVLAMALAMATEFCAFGLLDTNLLRSLPVRDPGRLVLMHWQSERAPFGVMTEGAPGEVPNSTFSLPEFRRLAAARATFSNVFAFAPVSALGEQTEVRSGGVGTFTNASVVSGGYFGGLGLVPALGRLISPDDDTASAAPVAVLSYRLWKQRFGARASAIGARVSVDSSPYTIIGVAPPEFEGLRNGFSVGIWLPIATSAMIKPSMRRMGAELTSPSVWWLAVFGRLRPGATEAAGEAELNAIFQATAADASGISSGSPPAILLSSGRRGEIQFSAFAGGPLWPFAAAAAITLLIAAAAVGGLLLLRARLRLSELATRLCLGATGAELALQTAFGLVFLCGAATAAAFAAALLAGSTLGPMVGGAGGQFGFHTGGFSGGLALAGFAVANLVVAVALGVAPFLRLSSRSQQLSVLASLTGVAATRAGNRRRWPWSRSLVAAQLAITFLLVAAASAFTSQLLRLQRANPGFDPTGVLTFNLSPASDGFSLAAQRSLYDRLLRRIDAIRGVAFASAASSPLVTGIQSGVTLQPVGGWAHGGFPVAIDVVGPDFLSATRIRLLAGRGPSWGDERAAAQVMLLNRAAAALISPDSSLLGRQLAYGQPVEPEDTFTVIGIVENTGGGGSTPEPQAFMLYGANRGLMNFSRNFGMTIFVRSVPGATVFPAVSSVVREVVPALTMREVTTAQARLSATSDPQRFAAIFASALAGLMLLLACGCVGCLQALVGHARRREFGIRAALGASRSSVLCTSLGDAAAAVAAGLGAGVALYLVAQSAAGPMQLRLPPLHVGTLMTAAALLSGCALLGAAAPALKAASTEAAEVLRSG